VIKRQGRDIEVKTKTPLLIGIGVVVVVLILVVTLLPNLTQKPAPQRILVYAYNDKITGIDPSIEDDTGLVVLGSIYETLTYYDYKTGEVNQD